MSQHNTKNISEQELIVLKDEIAARLKDTIYMYSDREALRMVRELELTTRNISDEPSDSTFTFTFHIQMVWGDILQIIGRQRRG